MAQTLAQITKQIEKLQKEADALRQAELNGVIDRIKVAISHYGLTPDQLGFRASAGKRINVEKIAAKSGSNTATPRFSNGDGQVWSGRGPRPRWVREALAAGRSLDEFSTDAQKRVKNDTPASKQLGANADVAPPTKAKVASKRSKAGVKNSHTSSILASTTYDGLPANSDAANATPAKAKRQQIAKKTSPTKKSFAASNKAPRRQTKRLNAGSAAARKAATIASAEKAVAIVPSSAQT